MNARGDLSLQSTEGQRDKDSCAEEAYTPWGGGTWCEINYYLLCVCVCTHVSVVCVLLLMLCVCAKFSCFVWLTAWKTKGGGLIFSSTTLKKFSFQSIQTESSLEACHPVNKT